MDGYRLPDGSYVPKAQADANYETIKERVDERFKGKDVYLASTPAKEEDLMSFVYGNETGKLASKVTPKHNADLQYAKLVSDILTYGDYKTSRGGKISSTIDLFGPQIEFDLRDGFPLLTSKKLEIGNIYHELLWFLRGESNINTLKSKLKPDPETGKRRTIWDDWSDEHGECGPIYGAQWREWRGYVKKPLMANPLEVVDQITLLLDSLKNSPDSRRHIVTAWQPAEIDIMKLPPCHCFFQCSVSEDGIDSNIKYLDLKMYQRSADTAIGVPYNIASYALLQVLLAQECEMVPRRFIHTFGSAHIYEPHIEKIKKQIEREPRVMPTLKLADKPFWDLVNDDDPDNDMVLENYEPHPFINYGPLEV